ncbi:ABC transporter ATP-binding protein [Slackia exigua]|uniref:ABC transporter ATP-binding protein n=1 Tax=Slackia exigua TaxID=84109 RepID=UPI0023EFBCF4|nr:ABC transporter ATP-binding protein [Slackia exigua]
MRVFGYLRHSIPAVFAIAALLIVQAFADLSLPALTSDIIDVGIQQSGIEDASPTEMRDSTRSFVTMLASEDDEALIESSYDETDAGTWELNAYGRAHRADLDDALSLPLLVVSMAEDGSVAGLDADRLARMREAYDAGALTKGDIQDAMEQAADAADGGDARLSQLADLDDDAFTQVVRQQGIQAAIAEYRALGYDTYAMQMDALVSIGARMLGMTAVMVIASVFVALIASRTAAKIARDVRSALFKKVVSFSDAEIDRFSAASLITRGTNDIQQIQMVLVIVLRMVLYAPILAVGGIVMVSRTNLAMSWIIVLAVVVIAVMLSIILAIAMPKFRRMQKLIDRVNLVAREMLSGILVVRAFGRRAYEEERFAAASGELRDAQLFTNRTMALLQPAIMLVMNAVSVLIVWVGGSYIDDGTIQTGDMIAFITYSMVIIMSFMMIGIVFIFLPRADVAAQRVNEVLETVPAIVDPAQLHRPFDAGEAGEASCRSSASGRVSASSDGESLAEASFEDGFHAHASSMLDRLGGAHIEFDDVSFSYGDDAEPALEHVSFVAEPGRTLAIIGATGSGKSTVLKLIERFYDATSGSIRVDGVDVRDMAQADLRVQLGYVPQKAFLFAGTIASNVSFADEFMSADRTSLALDVAQASDFVASKEEGVDSSVSQGGANVSGGQRQRLAIARAIAADARAYLFDDSFSALDYKTDAAVRRALGEALGNATVIIVAQRIATIRDADRIVVLDEGRVVGTGTHRELLRICPAYGEIASSQLSDEELGRERA